MTPSVIAALLVYTLLASATFLVAHITVRQFDPLALAQLRFVVAASALVGLLVARRGARAGLAALLPPPGLRLRVLVLGVLGTTLNQGLFLVGMAHTTPPHAALLYATTPLLVLVLAIARGQEQLVPLRAGGMALAFAGVAFLLFGRGLGEGGATPLGDGLVFAAVFAWAGYTAGSRELLARLDPLELTSAATVMGALVFLPIGIPAVLAQDWTRITGGGWFGLAYIGLVTSVVTYLIWSWALARTEASRVAVFTNLQPVSAALLAWALLGTPLTLHFAAATAIVLSGVVLAERR